MWVLRNMSVIMFSFFHNDDCEDQMVDDLMCEQTEENLYPFDYVQNIYKIFKGQVLL